MCLIGKRQLLCMQCRGIGAHLVGRGRYHGFSQDAAGTWHIFSSYDGDAHSKREFVYGRQDSCLGMTDNSGS